MTTPNTLSASEVCREKSAQLDWLLHSVILTILANARLLFGRHQSYDVVIGRESSTRCKACLIEYDEKLKKGGSVLGSVIIESKQCLPNTYAEDALRQLLVELEFNIGRRISMRASWISDEGTEANKILGGLEILAKIEGKIGLIYNQ